MGMKRANMGLDRAGGTSPNGSGNLPAIVVSCPESYLPLMEKLASRGFQDARTEESAFILQKVGYRHLSPYLLAVERLPEKGIPTVKQAHGLLTFDRLFKSILFKYIGILEVQMRAQYSHLMEQMHGRFALYDESLFLRQDPYRKAMKDYEREVWRALRTKKARLRFEEDGGMLPIWEGVERMSLGTLSKLYSNTADKAVTGDVAKSFGTTKEPLSSWLKAIAGVRNICAHFDAYITRKQMPSTPKGVKGVSGDSKGTFYIVVIILHLLKCETAPADAALDYASSMQGEIEKLATDCLHSRQWPPELVGFPENWQNLVDAAARV